MKARRVTIKLTEPQFLALSAALVAYDGSIMDADVTPALVGEMRALDNVWQNIKREWYAP